VVPSKVLSSNLPKTLLSTPLDLDSKMARGEQESPIFISTRRHLRVADLQFGLFRASEAHASFMICVIR